MIENAKLPTAPNNGVRVPSPRFKQRAQEVHRSLFGSFKHVKPAVKDIRPWRQGRWELQRAECLTWRIPCPAPAVPSRAGLLRGFIAITACFLRGQASQGSNPPVSTHINGLIGLLSPSQNAGLSLTEMLSPQSPSRLNTREMLNVSAKWSRHCPSLSHSHCCHSCFFPSSSSSVSLHHAMCHLWHQLGGNFRGFNLKA